jgi:hypothetical protein
MEGEEEKPSSGNRNDKQKNSHFQDHNIVFHHKHQYLLIKSHGAITQMTTILTVTYVKASKPIILQDIKASTCELF